MSTSTRAHGKSESPLSRGVGQPKICAEVDASLPTSMHRRSFGNDSIRSSPNCSNPDRWPLLLDLMLSGSIHPALRYEYASSTEAGYHLQLGGPTSSQASVNALWRPRAPPRTGNRQFHALRFYRIACDILVVSLPIQTKVSELLYGSYEEAKDALRWLCAAETVPNIPFRLADMTRNSPHHTAENSYAHICKPCRK